MRSPDPGLIAIFAVDDQSTLTLLGHASTRGLVPRNVRCQRDPGVLTVTVTVTVTVTATLTATLTL
jgi:6-phosphogluconolactonase (cycloisomerase 2 family)